MKKVGFVTLYGRANAGKSSILNKVLGYKIQAVSNKPQTTRENIRGIYNSDKSQIIFCDTPGLFKPHKRLGSILLKESETAKEDNDVLVYVFDSSLNINNTIKADFEKLPKTDNLIIAFNKIDLITTPQHISKMNEIKRLVPQAKIVEITCEHNFGVDKLISEIENMLPEGEILYPDDMISDRPSSFIYTETIREKCMRLLDKEVPHTIFIELRSVEESKDRIDIVADIYVERDSEKAIVIGKRGSMISKISSYSENAIKGFTGKETRLDLLVKVYKDWRNDESFLKKHGFDI